MPLYNSLEGIIIIVIMISIGYMLTHIGWFKEEMSDLFSKLVINISLPVMMFYSFTKTFTRDKLLQTGSSILIPLFGVGISYLIGIIISRLLKIKKGRRSLFTVLFVFSNSIFIGLPVNIALFGLESVPIVSMYYLVNTTFFWTFGLYSIRSENSNDENPVILKKIFTPALGGFLTAIIVILININIPEVITETCEYVGNLTTPLSMFIMGIILYHLDLSEVEFNREMLFIFIGQFIVTPLLMLFIFNNYFSIYPLLIKRVFVIEAAMPAMITIAIVSRAYDADHKYATLMVAATTAASMIVIPLYMLLLV